MHPRRHIESFRPNDYSSHIYIMQRASEKTQLANTVGSINVHMNSYGETVVWVEGCEGSDITVRLGTNIKRVWITNGH